MKSDDMLKADISRELAWDPAIHAAQVGVAVKDGVVTLTGHLDTYAEKFAIEKAAGRVQGVKALAVEMDVRLAPNHKRNDTEIAAAAEAAFQWHTQIPADRIQVRVEKGWVTLKGEVDWDYQRQAAAKAVRALTGVVGVSNTISLKSAVPASDVAMRIRDALTRHAQREAKDITVEVKGSVATLHGKVDSWPERAAVFGAVWSAPGISSVVNELTVRP
ncbi:OsmY domain-containing protein [Rhodoferax lacus]|uniref:OsmY domain-containing protein n=1 Tax=Rhodoferax lacus TaxID=2184758 RepID=A0A3E1R9I8_9BURK|nr:BON domain-containing protein [Rhodoferax lacus]RFO96038.1 OsmY domain-containing protein [Rhodoferax lacus]